MNYDNIIRMAREAGFYSNPDVAKFERFAALVAAAEREACAKVCKAKDDEWYDAWNNWHMHDDTGREKILGMSCGAMECAEAIRARGDK